MQRVACLLADTSIFIVEQTWGLHFNRGALMNAAALTLAKCHFDCLVFHDVDTVCSPESNLTYRCPTGAKHIRMHAPNVTRTHGHHIY